MALAGMNPVIFRIFTDLGFEPLIPHYLSAERAKEELAAFNRGGIGGDARETEAGNGPDVSSGGVEDGPGGEDARGGIDVLREYDSAGSDAGERPDGAADIERSGGVEAEPEIPQVEKRGVDPIEPAARENVDETVVHLDFGEHTDVTEEKDKRIRELGWKEYGQKLSDFNEREQKNNKQD